MEAQRLRLKRSGSWRPTSTFSGPLQREGGVGAVQPLHYPGPRKRLSTAPDARLPGPVSRARLRVTRHMNQSVTGRATGLSLILKATAHSPRFRERPWFSEGAGPRQPSSPTPRSTPGRGAAMATGAPRRAPPLPASRARLRGRASLLERYERGPSATKMVGAVGGKRGGQETREFALSLSPSP